MRPITSIGEIGVQDGEKQWFFRPSLQNIEALGSPTEIVEKFALCHSEISEESFLAAVDVLWACCESGNPEELTGVTGTVSNGWIHGLVPAAECLMLARSLMNHGVGGDADPAKAVGKKSDYTSEFHARDIVAAAVAHLGVSERDAWAMTMTSFVRAMKSKYGEPKQTTPTIQEHEESTKWLEKINRARSPKK